MLARVLLIAHSAMCDAHEVNEPTRIHARTPAAVPPARPLLSGLAGVLLVAIGACTTPAVTGPGPAAPAAPAQNQTAPVSVVARSAAPADGTVEVRLICLAPSPYSHRHDALRAGFGIYLLLQNLKLEQRLPIRISYYDGSAFSDDRTRIAQVLKGPRVIAVGGSTWAQGPSLTVRQFFELAGGQYLGGVSATAWATAGGAHTGGEEVVSGMLRSLMGMGAQTFTLGQKYMVLLRATSSLGDVRAFRDLRGRRDQGGHVVALDAGLEAMRDGRADPREQILRAGISDGLGDHPTRRALDGERLLAVLGVAGQRAVGVGEPIRPIFDVDDAARIGRPQRADPGDHQHVAAGDSARTGWMDEQVRQAVRRKRDHGLARGRKLDRELDALVLATIACGHVRRARHADLGVR